MLGQQNAATEVPQNDPTLSIMAQPSQGSQRMPVSWWGATTMPFCISSAFLRFCRLLRTCPLFRPYEKGATGCSRGALLEVNNLYPLQEPAWASTRVIVADPQLLQLTQVNGFDGEHIHLHRRQEANDRVSQKRGKERQ